MAKGDKLDMVKTIDYVQPTERKWEPNEGPPVFFIEVNFADGSKGSVGCAEAKIAEVRASLEALKGQAVNFGLTDNGDYQGTPQFKLRQWDGKPANTGTGGGNRGGGGGMSDNQVAMLAASNLLAGSGDLARLIELQPAIKELLQATSAVKQEEQPATQAKLPNAEQVTLPQIKTLRDLAYKMGLSPDQVVEQTGVPDLSNLTKADADQLIELWSNSVPVDA